MLMLKKGTSDDIILQLFYAVMAIAIIVGIFLLIFKFGDTIHAKICSSTLAKIFEGESFCS